MATIEKVSANTLKNELVALLKKDKPADVLALWSRSKDWAESKKYILGGSYSSTNTCIRVHMRIGEEQFRFKVDLSEV